MSITSSLDRAWLLCISRVAYIARLESKSKGVIAVIAKELPARDTLTKPGFTRSGFGKGSQESSNQGISRQTRLCARDEDNGYSYAINAPMRVALIGEDNIYISKYI